MFIKTLAAIMAEVLTAMMGGSCHDDVSDGCVDSSGSCGVVDGDDIGVARMMAVLMKVVTVMVAMLVGMVEVMVLVTRVIVGKSCQILWKFRNNSNYFGSWLNKSVDPDET